MSSSSSTTTFVVGATGATGKYVVQYLLDQGQNVKVICRSVEKMKSLLTTSSYGERLQITEASISQVSDQDLEKLTQDCTHVVSCLGHNMTLAGMFGREDRRLVTDAVTRLTKVMPPSAKFILMGTAGVTVPTDEPRSMADRTILFLCRTLLPPHCDNEETAAHFLKLQSPEWCMVRPTNLRDGEPQKHVLYSTPPGGLFAADAIVTRSTVAKFMVTLILDSSLFQTYKYQSPLIYDDPSVLTTATSLLTFHRLENQVQPIRLKPYQHDHQGLAGPIHKVRFQISESRVDDIIVVYISGQQKAQSKCFKEPIGTKLKEISRMFGQIFE